MASSYELQPDALPAVLAHKLRHRIRPGKGIQLLAEWTSRPGAIQAQQPFHHANLHYAYYAATAVAAQLHVIAVHHGNHAAGTIDAGNPMGHYGHQAGDLVAELAVHERHLTYCTPHWSPSCQNKVLLAPILIFAATYLVLAIGRLPWTRVDRTGAAIIGAALMLASGTLTPAEAYASIDYGTIMLLFGMMIVVANLRLSGFFTVVGEWVVEHAHRPFLLLSGIVLIAGVFSAFFVNDTMCLVLTPLVLEITTSLNRRPVPYLLAVAMASNIGSVATITGNPQNMMIGSLLAHPLPRVRRVTRSRRGRRTRAHRRGHRVPLPRRIPRRRRTAGGAPQRPREARSHGESHRRSRSP